MTKFAEFTGKTEAAAIEAGLEALGLDRDEVSVEVLERAKAGFLGIGATPAKVRLSYEGPDDEPAAAEEPAPAPKAEKKTVYTPPKAEETLKAEKEPKPVLEPEPTHPVDDEASRAITAFLEGLLKHMDIECAVSVELSERGAYEVKLEGEALGRVIGRRGDTLDAIQQLTGYAVNRGRRERVRVHLDAEGYRARREEALAAMARRTAERAIRMRRSITLEPMNAYERHVVHTALQDYPHITTHSVGAEPNRRTVISYDEAEGTWAEEE